MFTGIITDIGKLESREGGVLGILCHYDADTIDLGASIASDGCCLTVTRREAVDIDGFTCRYFVDVSNETFEKTCLGNWQTGHRINLERALTLGTELGGHIVTGHVDGIGKVVSRREDGEAVRFVLEAPMELAGYIAPKGSVALNGVSLTVNEVDRNRFGICLIPHTLSRTSWADRQPGDEVNLEIDLLARYVARMEEMRKQSTHG